MKISTRTAIVTMVPFLFLGLMIPSATANTVVYVSNGDDGEIAVLGMSPENGDLNLLGKAPAGPRVLHMAVSPDRRFLYASLRQEPFSVVSYAIDSETGGLVHLSTVPLPDNMVYLSTDHTGRFLFCASYTGGTVAVMPIGPKGFVQPEPVQVLNTGPNAHAIRADPSNRFVYVPHLGNTRISLFAFNERTGVLKPNDPPFVYMKEASGPRHFDFSPNNRFVYVSSELDGLVYAYACDRETGLLTEIHSISAVPRDSKLPPSAPAPGYGAAGGGSREVTPSIWLADIHITPDGKWLYASERTTNTIAAFAVDGVTGRLTYIDSYETETQPRGFNIDPRGRFVIAAGQTSDHVAVHAIHPETGELQLLKRYLVGKDPNWVEIVDLH